MKMTFKQRVENFWNEFCLQESEIRRLIEEQADAQLIMSKMKQIVNLAFNDISFEIGYKEKYELTLTPEGDRSKLFLVEYWRKNSKESLKKNWNFYSYKQAVPNGKDMELRIYDIILGKEDYHISYKIDETKRKLNLQIYSPKLMEIDEEKRYSVIFMALDQYIGEIYAMEYIGQVAFVDNQLSDMVNLIELKNELNMIITQRGWSNLDDPCQCYMPYKMNPQQKNEFKFRDDVIAGFTSCIQILNQYYFDLSNSFDGAFENGAVYGFVFYENPVMPKNDVIALRTDIEQDILYKTSKSGCADVIGGAIGVYYSYIDFLIYDLPSFIKTVKEVFTEYPIATYGFSEFKRNGNVMKLKGKDPDTLN